MCGYLVETLTVVLPLITTYSVPFIVIVDSLGKLQGLGVQIVVPVIPIELVTSVVVSSVVPVIVIVIVGHS